MTRVRHDHQHGTRDIIDFDTVPPSPIGVTQTVTLLGPFHVTFETADIADNGAVIGTVIPEGTLVLDMRIVVTTGFQDSGGITGMYYNAGIAPQSDPTNWVNVTGSSPDFSLPIAESSGQVVKTRTLENGTPTKSASGGPVWVFCGEDAVLVVFIGSDNLPLVAGEADVYALIATPS